MNEMKKQTKKQTTEQAIIESIICTLSHELGNKLVPLGHFLAKIESGVELTENEKQVMFSAYRCIEKTLRWLQHLNIKKLDHISYQSDRTGLLRLIQLEDHISPCDPQTTNRQ